MGSRKSHAGLFRTWCGEAAIMVSTSTFLLKNRVHTKDERKGKDESSKIFLENHCSYARVEDERCSNFKKKDLRLILYLFCERFVVRVPTLRRQLRTIIIKTPLHPLHSSKENSSVGPGQYQHTGRKEERDSDPKTWTLPHGQCYENAFRSWG